MTNATIIYDFQLAMEVCAAAPWREAITLAVKHLRAGLAEHALVQYDDPAYTPRQATITLNDMCGGCCVVQKQYGTLLTTELEFQLLAVDCPAVNVVQADKQVYRVFVEGGMLEDGVDLAEYPTLAAALARARAELNTMLAAGLAEGA